MHSTRTTESAARHMGTYQRAHELEHAANAMFLGNLFLRAIDRIRGLMRRVTSPARGPLVLSSAAHRSQ